MALSNILKRTLKISVIALVVVIAAAIAAPFLFKDKIMTKVKEAVNKDLNAKVDFKDVELSFFKHFPKLSVTLKGLDVEGAGDFQGVKLLHTESLDLALNFWSVWEGGNPYVVNSIHLEKPYINIVSLADGSANYNITKPKTTTEPSNFKLSLDNYSINNGTLIYDDKKLDFYMGLHGVNHEGSGDMTADIYDLNTKTVADSMTLRYGNMTYLNNAKVDLKTIINADMTQMKFTLKGTDATINALKLNLEGWTQLKKDDILMDFTFKAPSNNFKDFLSMIPAIYTKNYADVKATGNFTFDGFVKGTYNSDNRPPQYPTFKINVAVQNGAFQYPKLPMGATDINTALTVALPTNNYDDLAIDISRFHAILGGNPIDAVLHLRTPVSDPNVDLQAKGTLNLGDLPKIVPMESIQNLTGVISADITIKTLMSYVEKKMYDKVNMKGDLTAKNMNVQAKGYPTVFINDMAANFTPNSVNIDNFNAKLGKSDLRGTAKIDNILAFFSTTRTMTGDVNVSSTLFDANEWLAKTTPPTTNTTTVPPSVIAAKNTTAKPFDQFDFKIKGDIGQLIYDKYDIRNAAVAGHFTPNKFLFDNFKTQIGNSDIAGNGTLTGVFDWLFDDKTLGGNLNITSNMMDLNQFMTETPKPTTDKTAVNIPTEPFQIPKNIDVALNAKMGRVLYTNMDLRDLSGILMVQNQAINFDNAQASTLGGRIALKGEYNTQNPKPRFKMAYNMSNVDFQQSFNTFNTFQKFAPIGQYLKGKFNTALEFEGELGKDMLPNYNTLNISGFLQTIQGLISGFKPLEDIGNKLNITELKNLDVRDTKNWIEIKNGFITVKEFDKTVSKDINLKIGGAHSLANEMNYTVKARVPRKRLEANSAGQLAGSAFNNIVTEANKLGLNIKNSEFVNVQFSITGSVSQPKVTMKVLGGDGETTLKDAATATVNAAIEKAKDSVLTKANQKLEEAKEKAKQVVDKAVDSATTVVKNKVDEAKNKAIEEAKKRAGDELGKQAGTKVDSILNKTGLDTKTKQEVDKLKDKLNKFDPFKKKKDQ